MGEAKRRKAIGEKQERQRYLDDIFTVSAFVDDLEELKNGCLDLFLCDYRGSILDIAERRIPGFDKKKYSDIWETASE